MLTLRTLVLGLLFFAQAQTYPPPYPRPGTTKVMENDLVIVWDVSWLKQAYPTHRHVYDYAGIYYTDGDRIIVSERTAVRVQGGRYFPDMTAAHLNGSSAGGSLLKLAWIGIGMCMEISAGGQRIVTSPVRAISTAPTFARPA